MNRLHSIDVSSCRYLPSSPISASSSLSAAASSSSRRFRVAPPSSCSLTLQKFSYSGVVPVNNNRRQLPTVCDDSVVQVVTTNGDVLRQRTDCRQHVARLSSDEDYDFDEYDCNYACCDDAASSCYDDHRHHRLATMADEYSSCSSVGCGAPGQIGPVRSCYDSPPSTMSPYDVRAARSDVVTDVVYDCDRHDSTGVDDCCSVGVSTSVRDNITSCRASGDDDDEDDEEEEYDVIGSGIRQVSGSIPSAADMRRPQFQQHRSSSGPRTSIFDALLQLKVCTLRLHKHRISEVGGFCMCVDMEC